MAELIQREKARLARQDERDQRLAALWEYEHPEEGMTVWLGENATAGLARAVRNELGRR